MYRCCCYAHGCNDWRFLDRQQSCYCFCWCCLWCGNRYCPGFSYYNLYTWRLQCLPHRNRNSGSSRHYWPVRNMPHLHRSIRGFNTRRYMVYQQYITGNCRVIYRYDYRYRYRIGYYFLHYARRLLRFVRCFGRSVACGHYGFPVSLCGPFIHFVLPRWRHMVQYQPRHSICGFSHRHINRC